MATEFSLHFSTTLPSLSDLTRVVFYVTQNNSNGIHSTVTVTGDPVKINQFISHPTLQNPLVTIVRPTVQNGLLSDLTSIGPIYAPTDNWWNLRVDSAPLDFNNDAIINLIKSYDHHYVHPDFGGNYGIPYCVVDNSTPLEIVSISNTRESDAGYPGAPIGYPIPIEARTNKRYIENVGSTNGDRHLLVFNREKRAAFELSYASWNGTRWSAGYGAIFKLDSNYRRPEGYSSSDAGGFCVLAGLVRYDEVYHPDPTFKIKHATRFSIKVSDGHVWPASHTASHDANGQPMGLRLRLKSSINIELIVRDLAEPHKTAMRRLLQSWKEHGLLCADRGGNLYVQGTLDARWSNTILNPTLHKLNADYFEVIQLGWRG